MDLCPIRRAESSDFQFLADMRAVSMRAGIGRGTLRSPPEPSAGNRKDADPSPAVENRSGSAADHSHPARASLEYADDLGDRDASGIRSAQPGIEGAGPRRKAATKYEFEFNNGPR